MQVQEKINKFQEFLAGKQFRESVEIDFADLVKFSPDLADELLDNPEEVLKVVKIAGEHFDKGHLVPRFFNLGKSTYKLISDIRAEHIGKFLTLEGQVKGMTPVVAKVTHTVYECNGCGNTVRILQLSKHMKEPKKCTCGGKAFRMIDKGLINAFTMLLEDAPDLSDSPNLAEVKVLFTRDLTIPEIYSRLIEGTRIKLTGTVVEQFVEKGSQKETEITWYIDANHLTIEDEDYSSIEITEEDRKKILEYSARENVLEHLSQQIFCDLAGLDYEKKLLTLVAVGGHKIEKERATERGDIHALLVGDPSMGKTKIIKALRKVVPKSRYVSGGSGTSQVGLGGGVVRDEILGRFILVAGALPLAHKGLCIIDELDGLSKEDVKALNEATEEQQVTITKIAKGTFRAECSTLLIANPEGGRIDLMTPLLRQIKISPPLISRCDIIMLFKDEINPDRDASIIDVMFGIEKGDYLSTDFLRKYITVARNIKPTVTEEAKNYLKDMYVQIRQKMSNDDYRNIPITPREAYAMLRLAMACAKVKLKNKVELAEAKEAMQLKMFCLTQTAFDKESGTLDTTMLYTGATYSERMTASLIKKYLEQNEVVGSDIAVEDMFVDLNKEGKLDRDKFDHVLEMMKKRGDVFYPKPHLIRRL